MALSKNLLLFESIQNHGLRLRCWKLPKHDTKHPKSSMKFILRIHHLFACTLPNWLVSSMHTHFLLSFETCFLYSEYYWLGLPVHTEKTHVLCICVCMLFRLEVPMFSVYIVRKKDQRCSHFVSTHMHTNHFKSGVKLFTCLD